MAMQVYTQSHKAIHQALILTGAVAFIVSLAAGLQFYSSLGDTFSGVIIYGTTGVLLTAVAVILLPISVMLYKSEALFSALIFAILWAVLTGLAIFAEFGFFAKQQSSAENQRTASSEIVQQRQSAVDAAQRDLDNCPQNYITKCINPAQLRLSAAREALAQAPITADAMGDVMHPAYVWASRLTGIDGRTIQVYTTVIIVLAIELWASLAAYLLMRLFSRNDRAETVNDRTDIDAVGTVNDRTGIKAVAPEHKAQSQGFIGFLPPIPPLNPPSNPPTNPPNGKSGLALIYCADCGTETMQRTMWQKYCPSCTAKRKRKAIKQ